MIRGDNTLILVVGLNMMILASSMLPLARAPSSTSDGNDEDRIQCYYCGVGKKCQPNFDPSTTRTIHCDKSCMKFDGYNDIGKRVIVRDCGYFSAENECRTDDSYEGVAKGTVCHCKDGDLCNAAPRPCWDLIIVSICFALFFVATTNLGNCA